MCSIYTVSQWALLNEPSQECEDPPLAYPLLWTNEHTALERVAYFHGCPAKFWGRLPLKILKYVGKDNSEQKGLPFIGKEGKYSNQN